MSNDAIVLIFILVGVFVTSGVCFIIGQRDGYKKGQIDAISKNIKYKLVEFKDGTRGYYKESELKDLVEHTIIK